MKKYLWIFAGAAAIAACVMFLMTQSEKKAFQQFQTAQAAYSDQLPNQVVSVLEKTAIGKLSETDQLTASVYLAESYQALKQNEKAKQAWKAVLALKAVPESVQDRAKYELALLKIETAPSAALEELTALAQTTKNQHVAAGSLLQLAKDEEASGNVEQSTELYQRIINQYPDSVFADEAVERYGQLGVQLLFSKKQTPYSKVHVVRPGESLASIAKKYNMPLELLMESNNLTSTNIHPNDRLKVLTADFSIEISKTKNLLTLKANNSIFKVYPVGTGRQGSTPIGTFKVTSKLKEPTWYHPDGGVIPYGEDGNLLGTRWLGINSPGYGIHGTWEPESVGKQSSAGCVRLRNEDVEELYKIVTIGTEVRITE